MLIFRNRSRLYWIYYSIKHVNKRVFLSTIQSQENVFILISSKRFSTHNILTRKNNQSSNLIFKSQLFFHSDSACPINLAPSNNQINFVITESNFHGESFTKNNSERPEIEISWKFKKIIVFQSSICTQSGLVT